MSTKICPKCLTNHTKSGKFCSRSCANSRGPRTDDFKKTVSQKLKGSISPFKGVHKVSRIKSSCCGCGEVLYLLESEYSENKTCGSKECHKVASSIGGRRSAAKRITRSKDEIELFQLCDNHFQLVKHNFVISDGWDADIVIENLKVAILWNGPWHYKQMKHKNHSLLQVQNRDKIKIDLFKELGWKVFIFEDRYYTPESAFRELVLRV